MFTTILQRTAVAIAILTTLGILVHDTKCDKAVALALPVTTVAVGFGTQALDLGSHPHTHVERASLSRVFTGMPRIVPPKENRKYSFDRLFGRTSYFSDAGVIWPSI